MTETIKLDWSRLLGFDQALRNGDKTTRLGRLGAKFGSKPGRKPTGVPAK